MTSNTRTSSQDSSNAPTTAGDPLGRALDSVRARLLNLRTMPWSLRLAVTLVFIAILALGVTLALRDTLTGFQDLAPFAIGDGTTASRDVVHPSPICVVALGALGLAWALLLTGAIHSRWYVRFPALIVFSFFGFIEAAVGAPLGGDAFARSTGGESLALTSRSASSLLSGYAPLDDPDDNGARNVAARRQAGGRHLPADGRRTRRALLVRLERRERGSSG
jgi:hypothetical protein